MTKNTHRLYFLMTLITLTVFSACKTYIIPVESFKTQMTGIDSSNLKPVKVRGPHGMTDTYLANPLKIINCQTKDGKDAQLRNGPSIEMRVTYFGNKGKKRKRVFFFDRTALINGNLYGVQSRIIPTIRSKISIDSVRLIEVQDGHKSYKYIEGNNR